MAIYVLAFVKRNQIALEPITHLPLVLFLSFLPLRARDVSQRKEGDKPVKSHRGEPFLGRVKGERISAFQESLNLTKARSCLRVWLFSSLSRHREA